MTHDPLCPIWIVEPEGQRCYSCLFVARVRADEREKASQRVNALHVLADRQAWTIVPHEACVAAACGEAS